MYTEANKMELLGIKLMNKRIELFNARVSFRVSNSYFRDKKTRQQFVSIVNSKSYNPV